jgi:lipopolysaccharide/colanic/teichoic acid biosynthesis glycosyltransferase
METWLVLERPSVKLYKPRYRKIKRSLEILLCLAVTPPALLLGVMIGVIIRLDSAGPVFFVQERAGKGGKLFKLIKFRTMHYNVDQTGHQLFMRDYINGRINSDGEAIAVFKPFQANQVTRVGRFLRKTSLDELPQLINVLKGEMSLVGPRPNVPWEVAEYQGWHIERLEVLPGITGLAQVRGRSGLLFDQIVQYDIEYIKKQSLKADLQILWWTFISVIDGKGAQ